MIGLYDREIVERKVRNSMIKTAKREGFEKGKQKGIKEVVINMLKENIDINIISKVTGVSKNEILYMRENSDI